MYLGLEMTVHTSIDTLLTETRSLAAVSAVTKVDKDEEGDEPKPDLREVDAVIEVEVKAAGKENP